ncbi:carbonic anhydrase [Nitrospira lenta]|uniref:Carbonic anhydrase n=1 Tax=Nitrospira lenta TaxID=1436998 RepID=A0A330L5J0_9BACT|nr:carbonic anhydrase [Nitrospira lenta]SPP65109.1 Carbonic anhydrase [Nitrospira lenta]
MNIRARLLAISLSANLVLGGLLLAGFVAPNVQTSFNPEIDLPVIAPSARIHPLAAVDGSVTIGELVFVAPGASIRGDEGQNIVIGNYSNVQDGVVIHGLETFEGGYELFQNEVEVAGKKYSVYIGDRVSLAHQSQVHGPARVGDDTMIGMQALVFRAQIGDHVVIEPGAKLIGVTVAPGRYVPALSIITRQEQADALPVITDGYAYREWNDSVVRVNTQLARAGQPLPLNR